MTETELSRLMLCMPQQHCRVHGMGSQTMNSVSGMKPALMVTLRRNGEV